MSTLNNEIQSSKKSLLSTGPQRITKTIVISPNKLNTFSSPMKTVIKTPQTNNKSVKTPLSKTPKSVTNVPSLEKTKKKESTKKSKSIINEIDSHSQVPEISDVNITSNILSTPVRNDPQRRGSLKEKTPQKISIKSNVNTVNPVNNNNNFTQVDRTPQRMPTTASNRTPVKSPPFKHMTNSQETGSVTKRSPGPLTVGFDDATRPLHSTPRRITHANLLVTAETLSANKAAKRAQLFKQRSINSKSTKPVNISKHTASSIAKTTSTSRPSTAPDTTDITNSRSLINHEDSGHKHLSAEITRKQSFGGSLSPIRRSNSLSYDLSSSVFTGDYSLSSTLIDQADDSQERDRAQSDLMYTKRIMQGLLDSNDQASQASKDSISSEMGLLNCDISAVMDNDLATPHSMLSLTMLSDLSRSQAPSRLGDITLASPRKQSDDRHYLGHSIVFPRQSDSDDNNNLLDEAMIASTADSTALDDIRLQNENTESNRQVDIIYDYSIDDDTNHCDDQ